MRIEQYHCASNKNLPDAHHHPDSNTVSKNKESAERSAAAWSRVVENSASMADYPPPWDMPPPHEQQHRVQDASLSQTAAALANMLDENKEEKVLKEACVRLCQLFGEGIQNDRIQAILEANVVPKLVALLRPSRARAVPISVQSAALQVLGNVACGDDRQTQVVIDSDALPCLRALLASADRSIRKEVCWIVSNITESSHQVQDVLDADILPPLLKLLDSQDAACREDATWVLFNLSSNREPGQISYLADKNGVRALCNLLTCGKDLDVLWKGCGTVAAVALKGLRNILICGQSEASTNPLGYNRMAALVADAHGVERIEALTSHTSHDVRIRARLLLERMFGAEASTVDLQPPPTATPTASSASSSVIPSPPGPHSGCSCNFDHRGASHPPHTHAQHTAPHYPPPSNFDATVAPNAPLPPSSLPPPGACVMDQNGLTSPPGHTTPIGEHSASTSPSSTDSDPEDEDSDSDLIPPAPTPCQCVLCTDSLPLPEKRQRGKSTEGSTESEARRICDFCSGSNRLGDGKAGLAAKLGRAVRLGHSHCLAVLLSRMTWSQRAAATEAPALLHPGGGPPAGGYGSNLPAVTLAAHLGKPECLALLLRRCRPDLNQVFGKKRYTALAWACAKGYVRCARLLLDHGADPSTKCAEGSTALHLAAQSSGNMAICKMLLERNAPVNALTEKKQTPLCLAAQKGNWKIASLLLANGANGNNEDVEKYTPVHLAASNGYVDCLNLLLKADAHVDCKTIKGDTPLFHAVQGGHASCVRLLINAGAKVNCAKKPLLLIAADEGKTQVVQILLDALAVIDCKAYVKAYLDKETEISDHLTPLHLAASKGNVDVVDLLLRRGANVDALSDNSKWSALDFAVLNGHPHCAITLLRQGATVSENCKNVGRNSCTLVQYAAQQGAKEVVRLLVQRLKEQRMKAKSTAKFTPNERPDFHPTPNNHAAAEGLSQIANAAHDVSLPFPPPVVTPSNILHNPTPSLAIPGVPPHMHEQQYAHPHVNNSHDHHHIDPHGRPVPGVPVRPCNHVHDTYPLPHPDEFRHHGNTMPANAANAQHYDVRSGMDKRCTHPHDPACPAAVPQMGSEQNTPAASSSTRRRAPKEDREAMRTARAIKKREEEAEDARTRITEAMHLRSIPKLMEAIAYVSKLVLHLAPPGSNAPPGDYSEDPYVGPYTEAPQSAPNNNGGGNANGNRHHAHHPHHQHHHNSNHPGLNPPPGGPQAYAQPTPVHVSSNAPLPVEVGLGNEVMKARKLLAELQTEERRARDERAREAADNKRDTAQQSVLKVMTSTLQGGDSRILVRTVNRALRTILDSDDAVILEAKSVSKKIEVLEKAEEEMRKGKENRNLELLTKVVPIVETGLREVRNINGQGAADRIFGPFGPEAAISAAKKLCEELLQEKQAEEEERSKAEDRERKAKEKLSDALKSHDLKRMEVAIDEASNAVISKDSELSSSIDSAKKQFAKLLKGERRKLRQANSSNDADTIDAAVLSAEKKGLKSLEGDIKTSKEKAQKLRDQKQAKIDLQEAISSSDVPELTALRRTLKDLGMFEEEERARSELDTLQRAARARSLLENAIADAKTNIDAYKKKKNPSSSSNTAQGGKGKSGEWNWPDTQRLYDLTERSRKYGSSMQKLCDSAVELLKHLGATGREVLRNSVNSDDATFIAASISGYEKSFMGTTCNNLFGKDAGNRIITEARKKLALVQAADQAKVRAESRQVKQSVAMASSRRHNVKQRSTSNYSSGISSNKKDRTKENVSKTATISSERTDLVKETEKLGISAAPPVSAMNGTRTIMESVENSMESNNSSEYDAGEEEERTDVDGTPRRDDAWSRSRQHQQKANGSMHSGSQKQGRPRTNLGMNNLILPTPPRNMGDQIPTEVRNRSVGGLPDGSHYSFSGMQQHPIPRSHSQGHSVSQGLHGQMGQIASRVVPQVQQHNHLIHHQQQMHYAHQHQHHQPHHRVNHASPLGAMNQQHNSRANILGSVLGGGQTRGMQPARAAPALVGSLPIGHSPQNPTRQGHISSPYVPSSLPYHHSHAHHIVSSTPPPVPQTVNQHVAKETARNLFGRSRGRNTNRIAMSMAMPMNSMPMQQQYHSYDTPNRYTHGSVSPGTINAVGSTLLRDVGSTFGNSPAAPRPPAAAAGIADELGTDLGVEFASQNFGFDIDAIVDDLPAPPAMVNESTNSSSGNLNNEVAMATNTGVATRGINSNTRFFGTNSSGDNFY